MTAQRYWLPTALLLALALVPTLIHSYFKLSIDNSRSSQAVNLFIPDFFSVPSKKKPGWGEDIFGCSDWVERIYKTSDGHDVRLFIGRSYDLKRLYHHPELALSHGMDLRHSERISLTQGQYTIPVDVLRHSHNNSMAAFALYYDGHFVSDPIREQVKNSLNLLVSPKKPMTLFYVSENNDISQPDFSKTLSNKVLNEAIKNFLL